MASGPVGLQVRPWADLATKAACDVRPCKRAFSAVSSHVRPSAALATRRIVFRLALFTYNRKYVFLLLTYSLSVSFQSIATWNFLVLLTFMLLVSLYQ